MCCWSFVKIHDGLLCSTANGSGRSSRPTAHNTATMASAENAASSGAEFTHLNAGRSDCRVAAVSSHKKQVTRKCALWRPTLIGSRNGSNKQVSSSFLAATSARPDSDELVVSSPYILHTILQLGGGRLISTSAWTLGSQLLSPRLLANSTLKSLTAAGLTCAGQ